MLGRGTEATPCRVNRNESQMQWRVKRRRRREATASLIEFEIARGRRESRDALSERAPDATTANATHTSVHGPSINGRALPHIVSPRNPDARSARKNLQYVHLNTKTFFSFSVASCTPSSDNPRRAFFNTSNCGILY